jgi:hypothetical protein
MIMQDTLDTTDMDTFQRLILMLFSGSIARKLQAAQTLTEMGVPSIAELLDASDDANRALRGRALMALGALFQQKSAFACPDSTCTGGSAPLLAHPICANGQKSRIVRVLIEKLQHDDSEECRIMAAASLMKIGDRSGVKEVRRACLQHGKDFEGQVLDVVWGTSKAPGDGTPDALRFPRLRAETARCAPRARERIMRR